MATLRPILFETDIIRAYAKMTEAWLKIVAHSAAKAELVTTDPPTTGKARTCIMAARRTVLGVIGELIEKAPTRRRRRLLQDLDSRLCMQFTHMSGKLLQAPDTETPEYRRDLLHMVMDIQTSINILGPSERPESNIRLTRGSGC